MKVIYYVVSDEQVKNGLIMLQDRQRLEYDFVQGGIEEWDRQTGVTSFEKFMRSYIEQRWEDMLGGN